MQNLEEAEKVSDEKSYRLSSLTRGLEVIRAFGPATPAMSVSEVAKVTGLTRPTARRILLTLVDAGYAELKGRQFSLKPKILELGYSFISSLGWHSVAQSCLREITDQTLASANIAMLDGEEIIYILRQSAQSGPLPSFDIAIGSRIPAHIHAMGRVLLANLPVEERARYLETAKLRAYTSHTLTDSGKLGEILESVAAQGWAVVANEQGEGLCSLALPIFDSAQNVIAAIGIGWITTDQSIDSVAKSLMPNLRRARDEITSFTVMHGGFTGK